MTFVWISRVIRNMYSEIGQITHTFCMNKYNLIDRKYNIHMILSSQTLDITMYFNIFNQGYFKRWLHIIFSLIYFQMSLSY